MNEEIINKNTLNRYKNLFEYNFYTPNSQLSEDDNEGNETIDSAPMSELPQNNTQPTNSNDSDVSGDINSNIDDNMDVDISGDMGDDEIEIDITELVDTQDNLKNEVGKMGQNLTYISDNLENVMNVIDNLSQKVGDSINLTNQELINLKGEVVKRNPTETEKLKVRSLDSYPFNVNLNKYWDNQNNPNYNINKTNTSDVEEFVLTQKDIDNDFFNESEILKTIDEAKEITLLKMFNL